MKVTPRKTKATSLLLAVLGLAASSACVPGPSTNDQYYQDVVLTTYDTKANFGAFKTFALPDDITVVVENDSGTGTTVKHLAAPDVLKAISDNMKAAGYTEVAQGGAAPDLGFGLTGLVGAVQGYSSNYYCSYWYYWYYPYYGCYETYPTTYTAYHTKTLLIDLLDLKNSPAVPAADGGRSKVGVIWTSALYGVVTNENAYEIQRAVNDVNEAFAQSPYLKAGN